MLWQQLSLVLCGFQSAVYAYDVPRNLKDFYNAVSTQKTCTRTLKSGFGNGDNDYPLAWSYCELDNVLYVHHRDGGLGSMAIDVDGHRPPGDNPQDSQNGTAFDSILQLYNVSGVTELDPYIHPYVVLGNQGNKTGYRTFSPQSYGVQPLSVIAVVCDNKLFYGIWGDTNGDDDYPESGASVGEAAQSIGQAYFGSAVNASVGHGAPDVLYVAFKGNAAVPGAKGADWAASSFGEFEASIEDLGNRLVSQINSNGTVNSSMGNATGITPSPSPTGSATGSGAHNTPTATVSKGSASHVSKTMSSAMSLSIFSVLFSWM